MNKTTEPTVNISDMTDEQLSSLLSGEMSWEEAVAIAPGPSISIIEGTPEEIEGLERIDA